LGGFETSIASADSRLIARSATVWDGVAAPEPAVVVSGDVSCVAGADVADERSATVVLTGVVWLPDPALSAVVLVFVLILVLVLVGVVAQ
jgi:hypothetical protein